MTMNCRDIKDQIELYVLGGTGETESRLIAKHLSKCPDCRNLERQYTSLLAALGPRRQSLHGDSALVRKVWLAAQSPLKRARMRKRFRSVTAVAASIAAILLPAAFVWQLWRGSSDYGVEPATSLPESALRPARALWQKTNAVGTRVANADEIAVQNGMVFFLAGYGGRPSVSAVDADSGTTRWQSDLASCGYLETDERHVYCVALTDQAKVELAALDRQSGRVRWAFESAIIPGGLYQPSKPTVTSAGRICWVCENAVYALDARTGDEMWHRIFDDEGRLSRAAVADDCIYVAGRNGIYCMDGDSGDIRWHLRYRFYTWPTMEPLITATRLGRLFVAAGSKDGRSSVRRIDTSTQRCLWEKSVPRVTHLYVDSSHVYLRCQDVLALDQDSGDPVWDVKAAGCSPITAYDNMICFVDRNQDGRLVAVRCDTGQTAWQVAGLHSCNAFVKVGSRGYLKTDDSIVLAFAFGS